MPLDAHTGQWGQGLGMPKVLRMSGAPMSRGASEIGIWWDSESKDAEGRLACLCAGAMVDPMLPDRDVEEPNHEKKCTDDYP
jgi:hypothetical protein